MHGCAAGVGPKRSRRSGRRTLTQKKRSETMPHRENAEHWAKCRAKLGRRPRFAQFFCSPSHGAPPATQFRPILLSVVGDQISDQFLREHRRRGACSAWAQSVLPILDLSPKRTRKPMYWLFAGYVCGSGILPSRRRRNSRARSVRAAASRQRANSSKLLRRHVNGRLATECHARTRMFTMLFSCGVQSHREAVMERQIGTHADFCPKEVLVRAPSLWVPGGQAGAQVGSEPTPL